MKWQSTIFARKVFAAFSHIHYINIGVISLNRKSCRIYVSVFVPFNNFLDIKWRFIGKRITGQRSTVHIKCIPILCIVIVSVFFLVNKYVFMRKNVVVSSNKINIVTCFAANLRHIKKQNTVLLFIMHSLPWIIKIIFKVSFVN